jgi:hypothetical protein
MASARFQARIGEAIETGDAGAVRDWLLERFGIEVELPIVTKWLTHRFPSVCFFGWLDHSWRSYFKRRLQDSAILPCGRITPDEIRFECELHMGLISVCETNEQLAVLRHEDPTPVKSGPETPGIARTLYSPEPIDRVAARVVN